MEQINTIESATLVCEPSYVDTSSLAYHFQRLKFKIKNFFHRDDPKDSNLYGHAYMELDYAGYFKPDDEELGKGMNKLMADNVLELITVLAKQNHSGFSSFFAISLFETLARYKPLTPLTGVDSEWVNVADESGYPLYQNKRCNHVFKTVDTEGNYYAYDLDGKVFREPSGVSYTNKDSRVTITFPYEPKTEYIDVPASENS